METIKKRIITVDNMVCDGCEQKIKEALSGINGVKDVNADSKSGKIAVAYDLSKTELKSIEKKIREIGYSVKDSFIRRLSKSFIYFFEENEKDNLASKASPCCSNPREIFDKSN